MKRIIFSLSLTLISTISAFSQYVPENVELKEVGDALVVSWQRPAGTDGKTVTYNIYNKVGDEVATNLTNTEYTDNTVVLTGKQSRVYYRVSAVVDGSEGDKVRSNGVVCGDPYTLPFHDSFDKSNPSGYFWWGDNSGWSSFGISGQFSVDDEYGAMVLTLYEKDDRSTINTGKIDLSSAANPALMFSQGVWGGYDMQMNVYVTKADGTKELLKSYDYKSSSGNSWGREVVSLAAYKSEPWIMINFEPQQQTIDRSFVIDNVYVLDYLKYNLQAKVTAPQHGAVDVESMITVKVTNLGEETAKGYKVHLYKDGELFETVTDASNIPTYYDLARFFYVTPSIIDNPTIEFTATVEYSPDLDLSDNEAGPVEMEVMQPDMPYVDDLMGEVDEKGRVVLNWTIPEIGNNTKTTDGFDLYAPWSMGGFGFWKTVDNDFAFTYGVNGVDFDGEGSPMAFIVFNPEAIGINTTTNPEFAPYSGQQYLMCLASVGSQTPEGHNDDWLISPMLSGNSQTISFFAKAMSVNYKETFEIYYSTTTNGVEDFTLLRLEDNVPTDWTQYDALLPEGTKYFAIRVISADAYALMLDDITYEPAQLERENFIVYRDRKVYAALQPGVTTYTDSSVNGSHDYRVGVVYNMGHSRLSNTVTLEGATGIEETTLTEATSSVVYDLQGRPVETPSKGIYIVGGRKIVKK